MLLPRQICTISTRRQTLLLRKSFSLRPVRLTNAPSYTTATFSHFQLTRHAVQPLPQLRHISSTSCILASKSIVQFNLADIGEGITECEVVQWFVKSGDSIQQFDKICEVQSDKATVEITSRYDGTISKLHYAPGDIAKVGSPLIDIETESEESSSPVPPSSSSSTSSSPSSSKTSATIADSGSLLATPAVRRMARELAVDLLKVTGTGKNGRIMKEDLISYSESLLSSRKNTSGSSETTIGNKSTQFDANSSVITPLTPVQKAMVKSMTGSLAIPHFGFSDGISFEELRKTRHQINKYLQSQVDSTATVTGIEKISYMPLLLKSFSMALERFPVLNGEFIAAADGQQAHMILKRQHNIAVAIDSPQGLVVPNIKNVQDKSVLDIAIDLQRLVNQAKKNQLSPDAFSQPTITISNIGNLGGDVLKPVIPPGTVCIVAIGKSRPTPQYTMDKQSGELVLRPEEMATVSFSADHRVVDGATVARFFSEWKAIVENPAVLLLHSRNL